MGDGAAVGFAVGGPLGGLVGASHDSGQDAANAQGNIAKAQLAQQRADRKAAMQAAEPSAMELEQLQRSIELNNQDIGRKQKLLDSSDPALIEAGAQALKLLKGEEAKALAPIRSQQAKERQKLEESLRQRLGSGYATSTAGIQALSAFDEQAMNVQTNAQQQTLGQLLGVAQNTSASYGMQNNISNAGNIAQARGNINNRSINAINGTPITGAGAQFVGDLQTAKNNQQTIGNIIGVGSTIATLATGMPTGGGGAAAGGGTSYGGQPAKGYGNYA